MFSVAGFDGDLVAGLLSSRMLTISIVAINNQLRFIYNSVSVDLLYDSDSMGVISRLK